MRGSGSRDLRSKRLAPDVAIEGGAEGALDVCEHLGGNACDGAEDGHVAGERLERCEPEALAVGRDEDRVGGVDVERDAVWLDVAER